MASSESPSNHIRISSSRKPVSYIYRCKLCLKESGEVHLSALGLAMSSLVTLAEIMKSRNLVEVTKCQTNLEKFENRSPKCKMEVIMVKSAQFDEIMAADEQQAVAAAEDGDEEEEADDAGLEGDGI